MFRAQLALISQSALVDLAQAAIISAAIQKQLTRDLSRHWPNAASIDVFRRLGEQPTDYWPIVIRDDLGYPGVSGIHWAEDRQPFALVQASANLNKVSLAVSHEALEMTVDPSGDHVIAGQAISAPDRRVNYLVEICDPCQKATFGYHVNGVLVSDFLTPNYFDPVRQPGVAYSFGGNITQPKEILSGGYVSWVDPQTNHLWQAYNDGNGIVSRDGGRYDPRLPIRFQTDRLALVFGDPWEDLDDNECDASASVTREAFESRGKALEEQIERMIKQAAREQRK